MSTTISPTSADQPHRQERAPGGGLIDGSIADTLFAQEAAHSEAPLLSVLDPVTSEWQELTLGEVARRVRRLAAGFVAVGVAPGERVAIMSRTRLEWTLCDYALLSIGAVTVPIYETSSLEQVRWILSDSGARAICCESVAMAEMVAGLRAELPDLQDAWCFEQNGVEHIVAGGTEIAGDVIDERRRAVRGDDLATIVYTSGTTGRPKGCELTHANCLADLAAVVPGLSGQLNPEASTLLFLPLAHIFGRAIQIGAISTRTRLGYCSDTKDLVAFLQSFKPTFVLAVPRVFEKVFNTAKTKAHHQTDGRLGHLKGAATGRIFDDGEQTAIDFSIARAAGHVPLPLQARHELFDHLVYGKLREALGGRVTHVLSSGGPLGARLGHFFDGVGVTVLEVYGLTETIASTYNHPGALHIGSVGRAVPGSEVRIAEDGEVLLKGPNVFRGYWHNEAATAATFDGDWFKSGDLGEVDVEGYLTITGRKKDLIVTSAGKNVAPAVLEDRLRAHRLISQCLVVGDARPFIGCLVTIDPDAWPDWAAEHGKAGSPADHLDDPDLRAEIQRAVDHANELVSRAESIRKFVILPDDFTEASGEMTPTLKLKRNVINTKRAAVIEALYE